MDSLKANHQAVVTLEDGILVGGLGEQIASYYGKDDIKVLNYGLEKKFYDRYNPEELLRENGFDNANIISNLKSCLK